MTYFYIIEGWEKSFEILFDIFYDVFPAHKWSYIRWIQIESVGTKWGRLILRCQNKQLQQDIINATNKFYSNNIYDFQFNIRLYSTKFMQKIELKKFKDLTYKTTCKNLIISK